MNPTVSKHVLRPSDSINIGFALFLFCLTLFFREQIPAANTLLLIYASLIVFQIILVRIGQWSRALQIIRDIVFPVVAVMVMFDSLGLVVHYVNPQDIDHLLIRLDYQLFGFHPTVSLEAIMHPLLSDILQIAYTTYYFLPIAMGVSLWRQGNHDAFHFFVFMILLCFYLTYIGYLLFPALGPRYAMAHLQTADLPGSIVTHSIQSALNWLEGVKRDAFPSGHTGIALTALLLAWRFDQRLFRIFAVPVLLLVAATVYCRYHYVVDVFGGIALVVVTWVLGGVYYTFWARRNGYSLPESK
ncbi:MAG: PAP2 superfamily protein [Nitrospirae bacterium]|nr:MAG: PAP2 superfamily protein [Nitrospirota bacterium]